MDNYGRPNNSYGAANNLKYNRGQAYGGMHTNPNPDFAALAHSFQGMNMQPQSFAAQAKNAMMPANAGNYGGLPMPSAYAFPNNYGATPASPYWTPTAATTPHASQYMQQLNYQGYQHHDNSPLSQYTGANGEVPTLITPRRDSISSNENDQPATPSYAGYPGFPHGGVAINRSPSGIFAHSTPSPTSLSSAFAMKQPEQADLSPRLKLLLMREPAIPRAIPAPSSPQKPLDRALENQRGETNVYIRGLMPETTDEILENWGARFGDIKSSKSIIDLNTGLCKGYATLPSLSSIHPR